LPQKSDCFRNKFSDSEIELYPGKGCLHVKIYCNAAACTLLESFETAISNPGSMDTFDTFDISDVSVGRRILVNQHLWILN
jgi:hypothetical protein